MGKTEEEKSQTETKEPEHKKIGHQHVEKRTRQNKEPRFDKEIDDKIIEYMEEYKGNPNRFVMFSKKLPAGYSAKRIRQHWENNINPSLNREPFDDKMQHFINKWVEDNKIPGKENNYKICWIILVGEIKKKFGKRYSENRVKNYWYSKKRVRKMQISASPKEGISSPSYVAPSPSHPSPKEDTLSPPHLSSEEVPPSPHPYSKEGITSLWHTTTLYPKECYALRPPTLLFQPPYPKEGYVLRPPPILPPPHLYPILPPPHLYPISPPPHLYPISPPPHLYPILPPPHSYPKEGYTLLPPPISPLQRPYLKEVVTSFSPPSPKSPPPPFLQPRFQLKPNIPELRVSL